MSGREGKQVGIPGDVWYQQIKYYEGNSVSRNSSISRVASGCLAIVLAVLTVNAASAQLFDFKGFRLGMTIHELDSVLAVSSCWRIERVTIDDDRFPLRRDTVLTDTSISVELKIREDVPEPTCCRLGCYRQPGETCEVCVFHTPSITLYLGGGRVSGLTVKSVPLQIRDKPGDCCKAALQIEAWIEIANAAISRQVRFKKDSVNGSQYASALPYLTDPFGFTDLAWWEDSTDPESGQGVSLYATIELADKTPLSSDDSEYDFNNGTVTIYLHAMVLKSEVLWRERLNKIYESRSKFIQAARNDVRHEQEEYDRLHPPAKPDF